MGSPRRAFLVAAAVLAGLGLVWLVLRPDPVRVELGRVSRAPLEVTVDEEGRTRVRDRYVVAAPVTGRLQRITHDEGDVLARGDVVARIDPAPLDPRTRAAAEARLESAIAVKREADARVTQAGAALTQAERELRRARTLASSGTLSPQALEQAQLAQTSRAQELTAAREGAEAALHEIEAARAVLLATDDRKGGASGGPREEHLVEVRAPAGGQVLRIPEKSERVVGVGTPLVEIGDPAKLEIVIDVLSADAVKVSPGAVMRLEAWGGEKPLAGRVRRIEPSGFTKLSALGVEEQRVNVIGDFVDPPGALGDGYRLEARIVVWEGESVLQAPGSALFRRGEDWHVFVVGRAVARLRRVEVGHRGSDATEIVGGLAEGEEVVLHPTDRLADGVRVEAF
jgi:HlyD family secretion protein